MHIKKLETKLIKSLRIRSKNTFKIILTVTEEIPKKMWNGINQFLGKGSTTTHITSLNVGNSNDTNKTNTAESMNEYFTSIGPALAAEVPVIDIESQSYVDRSESVFVFKSINIDEVYNALNNLKASKSLGPDRIPARLPKRFLL